MLIVAIFGGLGNQMFQYATARSLATKLSIPLKLDLTLLKDRTERKDFTYREYELDMFNISTEVATKEEISAYVPNLWNASKWEKRYFLLKRIGRNRHLYLEKQLYTYEHRIQQLKDSTYLYGYFQNEQYFKDSRSLLLSDFAYKKPFSAASSLLIEQINSEINPVSIHVRRGDYVASESVAAYHGCCGLSYYEEAIARMEVLTKKPVFYVFSDDVEWARKHISRLHPRMVIIENTPGKSNAEDMILMSHCKHNIIANSSFSWWGAWLNSYESKRIIAPARWTKREDINQMAQQTCPSEWIRI